MDITEILRHVLIVLVAAKVSAEVAERLGVPAVVGEILAGVLIGPSALGLVGGDDVLRALGEIGVILLLLDVGMEMDLAELGRVGRASVQVATVGVIVPLLLGMGAMELIGDDAKTALFVGAALTATSVGITARVFGDLRALATTEARIVLGAAVADDVMGLIVLTVVVRLVTEGSVSALSILGIVVMAVAFLVVGGLVGLRVAPPLFAAIDRLSRSTGTLVALALAFTLGYAELANAAKLAPIVGAFVAGIALSRTREAPRIRRELGPVGHLFIPVFFLQIGIDAEIGRFVQLGVLRDAALLLAVAVVGKLVSPLGAWGSPGDKTLIGLGMLPRGEVGLIFATLGLQNGVLGEDLYAALLLVVLLTTLITPQLLKVRYAQIRGADVAPSTPPGTPPPEGGWLVVTSDEVELAGRPPDDVALPLSLTAAIALARRRPGPGLLDWLAEVGPGLEWTPSATSELLDVVERGNARSWRFLTRSGVLDRIAPELAAALTAREEDRVGLDPLDSTRFPSMERLRMLDADDPVAQELAQLARPDAFLVAAFLSDALEDEPDTLATARAVLGRLALPPAEHDEVVALVSDRDLLWSAARQPAGLTENPVQQLAAHLESPERARALFGLTSLRIEDRERWEVTRLRTLYDLVQSLLTTHDPNGPEGASVIEARRRQIAIELGDDVRLRDRLAAAPRAYLLRTDPEAVVRHLRLLEPRPVRNPRVAVTRSAGRTWIDVAWEDRPGLLAAVTHALAAAGWAIDQAVLATWPDGAVVDSFAVGERVEPDPTVLSEQIEALAARPLAASPLPDAEIEVVQDASPWHTVCEVRASDRPGLLASLATAFAGAGIEVRSAVATALDDLAIDRFEVTDRTGRKLDDPLVARWQELVRQGARIRPRRFGRRLKVRSPE